MIIPCLVVKNHVNLKARVLTFKSSQFLKIDEKEYHSELAGDANRCFKMESQ